MSKADEYKEKLRNQAKERNARKELMGGEEESTTPAIENKDDKYTITLDSFNLQMAHPEQTFGRRNMGRTDLIGCHFEPEVAKVLKKDQKQKGRGWQSHLVNELVKEYYKQMGKL